MGHVCANCAMPAAHRCGGCRAVEYCGRACQEQHWEGGHKSECGGEKSKMMPAAESEKKSASAPGDVKKAKKKKKMRNKPAVSVMDFGRPIAACTQDCPICLYPCQEPLQLRCGDVLCRKCLVLMRQHVMDEEELVCPVCCVGVTKSSVH